MTYVRQRDEEFHVRELGVIGPGQARWRAGALRPGFVRKLLFFMQPGEWSHQRQYFWYLGQNVMLIAPAQTRAPDIELRDLRTMQPYRVRPGVLGDGELTLEGVSADGALRVLNRRGEQRDIPSRELLPPSFELAEPTRSQRLFRYEHANLGAPRGRPRAGL